MRTEARVTGHVQVKGEARARKYFASWIDRDGIKHTRTLGRAWVRDSGRRTPRGATVWRAADGSCPPSALTPKAADDALEAILEEARRAPREASGTVPPPQPAIPSFGDAVDAWLRYVESEKERKRRTVQDYRNVVGHHLLPRFGRDTPLYRVRHDEVVLGTGGSEQREWREERTDTFGTDDIDAFRADLLARRDLSRRTAQKVLALLHSIFKLAKRGGLIERNPSEDAERVTLISDGRFNILEPVEFEAVYRAVLDDAAGQPDEERECTALDELEVHERPLFGALLSTAFYAGLRLGELRDLPWRCVDFHREMLRVESGYSAGERSTTKGKRGRSTPMVPVLAERLARLGQRRAFTGGADYVFSTNLGQRVNEQQIREVFYAALAGAAMGERRDEVDERGNAQKPIVVHDLRHSFCSWAVNAYPVTAVKEFAGHRDLATTMKYVHRQTKAEDAQRGGAYLDCVLAAEATPA